MALEQTIAYLLLGSNLGDKYLQLEIAIQLVEAHLGLLVQKSSLYETAAWGKTDQPAFVNQAIAIKTHLPALEVLNRSLNIEKEMGRIRLEKWGERLIDIDLILFGDQVIQIENKLQVPHPQMQFRRFVMEPLAEIAPELVHPVLGKSMIQLFNETEDTLEVKKMD